MKDPIERQAAIDAVSRGCQEFRGIFAECEKNLNELPSAQPDSCVDTIDALNESIKHFDDMAEKCRRNANIERNDYMDMRDDAAEYRQLSIWLNELKWLRERVQSQPEQKWIPCSERLPGEYGWYVTTLDNGDVVYRWYSTLHGWETHANSIIAWLPKPEPYGGYKNG